MDREQAEVFFWSKREDTSSGVWIEWEGKQEDVLTWLEESSRWMKTGYPQRNVAFFVAHMVALGRDVEGFNGSPVEIIPPISTQDLRDAGTWGGITGYLVDCDCWKVYIHSEDGTIVTREIKNERLRLDVAEFSEES